MRREICAFVSDARLRVSKSGVGTQDSELIMCMHACYACMHMMHACILCMHTYNAHARAHAHKKTGEPQAKSSPDHRWGARSAPQPRRRRGFCGLGLILFEFRLFSCVHARVRVHCVYALSAYVCMHTFPKGLVTSAICRRSALARVLRPLSVSSRQWSCCSVSCDHVPL